MKLEPVKKYNKPKYPNEEVVRENKELLLQPLDRWKKIGVTSVVLTALLMKLDAVNVEASEGLKSPSGELYGGFTTRVEYSLFDKMLENGSKRKLENYSMVEELAYDDYITTSEFGQLIEGFFDWLLVQGIM